MGHAFLETRMTADDFLDWESRQAVRHEFVRGEVFAMAGAEDRHATLALNVAMALRSHLRGTPCRTFMSDMKVRVDADDAYYYPDVLVTCSPADAAERLVKREPLLIVEVLSPSTAGYDRGDKFASYRRLSSLREYLVVDPRTRRSDLYRLGADGLWVLHPSDGDHPVTLASVGLEIGAEALWEEVPPADEPADPDPSAVR